MGMIDVTLKPIIRRLAVASGTIYLSRDTIAAIKAGKIKKGDPLIIAEIAGMNAAKQTHLLIPHCHQISLDVARVDFNVSKDSIEATCTIGAQARTGVEMEAIVGVSIALNTIWDVVKYLEKNEDGQYPATKIANIRVLKKIKKI
jgi:cyclic pyranopterin phosphate synthase